MQTEEKKEMEMNNKMMGNQFFGDVEKMTMSKECAIVGLIKNQKIVLEEEYSEAKDKYAGAILKDKYCPATYEAEFKCRLLEAKLDVVSQMQRDIENMLPPMAMVV